MYISTDKNNCNFRQPKKKGASIVDNSSAEKKTDVTSKENLPESEKCVEESNSVDKFSLIRKYLNSKGKILVFFRYIKIVHGKHCV